MLKTNKPENKVFGQNLKYYMKERKVNRLELEKLLRASNQDVSYSAIGDWLNGRSYPKPERITALAKILNVSKADLTEDKNTPFTKDVFLPQYITFDLPRKLNQLTPEQLKHVFNTIDLFIVQNQKSKN